jgi:Tfp pilus assembly protein PilX
MAIKVKKRRGVAIYFAVLIMVLVLAMALGLATILFGQIKMASSMGDSVIAFYAADTGMEEALYRTSNVSGDLGNGASFYVVKSAAGRNCAGYDYCLKSIGSYKNSRRAIEVVR